MLGGEGGSSISSAVGNSGGNPKYLIKPDKSYARYSSLPSTVKPHVCNPNPSITVTYPNGGEIVHKGNDVEITWSSKNYAGEVKIELLKNNSVEEILSSSEENDGSFLWSLSSASSTGNAFEIRITSLSNSSVLDKSDGFFSISEEVIINGDYTENFDTLESGSEVLPAGYIQSNSDDFNWIVLSGPTPSKIGLSPNVTGPDGDFTSGGADGNYLYVEASDPNNPGKKTDFETPKININNLQNPELDFYYHMFSDSGHMGSLSVDICMDGQWSNGEFVLGESDYGDEWHKASIDLTAFRLRSNWIKIRFSATTGESWASDIGVDDISIKDNPVGVSHVTAINQNLSVSYCNSQLKYVVPERLSGELIEISIFNMQGKEVYKKISSLNSSNSGIISFRGTDISNGIYTAHLKAGSYSKLTNFIVTR